jgi:outer membrane protein assembly factor BamB
MRNCLLHATLFLCCFAGSGIAADWPQWRGPKRDGHAFPDGVLLKTLPAEPKTVWKIKAGPGVASSVVAGDTVIHFDAVEGKETIHSLDRHSGKTRWTTTIDETFHDNQGPDGPRCTPLIDGENVYALSCRGQLECLRLKDGGKLWGVSFTRDLGAEFIGEKGTAPGASRHGNNGTPLVVGERLYASVGGEGAGVVCFDKQTGKVIWKSQNDDAAYAPPMIANLGGIDQLICFTAEGLISLSPRDGELFWRVPIKTAFARHVTAPLWYEDVVVVSSHQVGMIGTRVRRDRDVPRSEQAWLSKESAMNFSSPVSVGPHLYGLGPRKNLICVEIATGKQLWSKEGYFQSSADKAYGGFLVIGRNVLALTDGGMLVLFEANPLQFKELGTAQVCGVNWCNPAYADGRLYLRDGNKGPGDLLCVNLIE